MIRLDDRAGSRELYSALLATGVKVQMQRLPYGDVEFDGQGPDDMPVLIGVEHKQVSDAVKCMLDGRFAGHQLPGLVARYDFSWLVVEGCTRRSSGGGLQVMGDAGGWHDACAGSRFVGYADFDCWLLSQEMRGGIRVRRTRDQAESAAFIAALHSWWSRGWQNHTSHRAFNLSDNPPMAMLTKPGLVRRMAKELPGIGWERSAAIESAFISPVEMVAAERREWEAVDGIGRTMAERIMKALGSDKLWSG